MNFYSQYGEDRIFSEHFGSRKGHLLEIGAWGPRDLSNSRHLIEQGWQATLVDFAPMPIRDLLKEYGYAEKVQVIQAALTDNRDLHFSKFEITDDALSSNDDRVRHIWREKGGYYGFAWVPTIPVSFFLGMFGRGFDLISVDTEGTSTDLARTLISHGCQPEIMCVEHDGNILNCESGSPSFNDNWGIITSRYSILKANGTNVILKRL